MSSQDQQLGNNSEGYLAGRDNNVTHTHHHYHYPGVADAHTQELAQRQEQYAVELWEKNAPRLVQKAEAEFLDRAREMSREVITSLISENPDNLERLGEARSQVPLLKAQQSYGETGNADTVPHLANLVAQLIASPTQSYTEMISRRCIDCLTNMTSSHLNLITVMTKLQRRWFPNTATVEMLTEGLRSMLGPYIGKIPTEGIEYSYINSLGIVDENVISRFASAFTAGGVNQFSPYYMLRVSNPNAMYGGFHIDDLPDLAKTLDPSRYFMWDNTNPDVKYLNPEFSKKWLVLDRNYSTPPRDRPSDPAEIALVTFCENKAISAEQLKTRIRSLDPQLADLLDTLEKFDATAITLNPVGLMLVAQEETIRANGIKSDLFADLDLYPEVEARTPIPESE